MSTLAFILVIFSASLHAYWNLIAKRHAHAHNPCGVAILGIGTGKSLKLLRTDTLAKLLPFLIGVSIVGYTLVDNAGVKQVSPIVYAAGLTLFTLIFLLPLRLW